MEIRIPEKSDWDSFERLAAAEGWSVPRWELAFYRDHCPESAAVLLDDLGPCGFVTAVAFGSHGWIGNLIVAPDCRGRGFGARLFAHALEILERNGCGTLWLTASAEGRALYERFGFRVVDQVERWVLADAAPMQPGLPAGDIAAVVAAVVAADTAV